MTSNQIAYWRNVETERSNRAQEAETSRSHLANEKETQRHNLMTEALGFGTLQETKRHNQSYESELNRHNLESERLGWSQLGETQRHNIASESLGYSQLQETARHNVASEELQRNQVQLGYANLSETSRHNLATEAFNSSQLLEQSRHNQVSEFLSRYQTDTTATTQRSGQQLSYAANMYGADLGYNAAKLRLQSDREQRSLTAGYNILVSNESIRHNKAMEHEEARRNTIQALSVQGNILNDATRNKYYGLDVAARTSNSLLGSLGQLTK